ncbi:MAG: hypothetical protein MZV64_02810 [Ignavibacteriales bacterium]|nr:hypothetical protein [Ignavibacteriales bacterium]
MRPKDASFRKFWLNRLSGRMAGAHGVIRGRTGIMASPGRGRGEAFDVLHRACPRSAAPCARERRARFFCPGAEPASCTARPFRAAAGPAETAFGRYVLPGVTPERHDPGERDVESQRQHLGRLPRACPP